MGLAFDIRVVEEIVAKVNGDIITRGDIERTRQTLDAQLKQEGLTGAALQKAMKEREKDALREQIDQLLLVQHGKDLNINVDSEVTKRIAQIQLDSKIADLNNAPDWPFAGAIIGALFLAEFVAPETPWLHLDMMAWNAAGRPGRPEGGEATGLRALYAMIAERAAAARAR